MDNSTDKKNKYSDSEMIEILGKAYMSGFIDGAMNEKHESRTYPSEIDYSIRTFHGVSQEELDRMKQEYLDKN